MAKTSIEQIELAIKKTFAPAAEAQRLANLTFMNVEEAAKYIRVSKSTLDKWRGQGIGPAWCSTGKRVVYERKDLDAYIQAGKIQTADQF